MTDSVFLNNDRKMPLLGLGVYKATGENEAENAVIAAVQSGYRMIDTAPAYKKRRKCGPRHREMRFTAKRSFYNDKNLEYRSASGRY